MPKDIYDAIASNGIRNSHLTAIAPTGTISLLANNISSGIEPVYDFSHSRRVLELDGTYATYELTDYAYYLWQGKNSARVRLPSQFVDAQELSPSTHLDMQAALQPYVDNAISKTINIPENYLFEDFRSLYELAFEKGLKGCTTFRPNAVTGAVLSTGEPMSKTDSQHTPHCCSIDREAE